MKSEYPYTPYAPTPGKKDELIAPPPSRFVDERLSGESDRKRKRTQPCRPPV